MFGDTTTEEPVTAPTPGAMERLGAGLPETDHERVDEPPVVIVVGEVVKEETTGPEPVDAATVTNA